MKQNYIELRRRIKAYVTRHNNIRRLSFNIGKTKKLREKPNLDSRLAKSEPFESPAVCD